MEFSATRLRELAKMDGAIVLDRDVSRILRAAVQLVPDSSIETSESGTRHRTAERVAKQTGFPVISVSQSMRIVAVYTGNRRYVLEGSDAILGRANQALQTLERYRARLDEVTGTLSALEIEDLVTVRDVCSVVQRIEMVSRIADEISGYVVELGVDGRLLSLQLDELVGGVGPDRELVVRDYLEASRHEGPLEAVLDALAGLHSADLVDLASVARVLGFSVGGDSLDSAVSPKGFRLLNRVPAPARRDRGTSRRPVRGPAEAPGGQHRRPHDRRRRRRAARPRGARGALAAGRELDPRTLRLRPAPAGEPAGSLRSGGSQLVRARVIGLAATPSSTCR